MYALAIDGELVSANLNAEQVLKNLKVNREDGKIEVASFVKGKGWMPVCIEKFALPRTL